jgi:acyl-CoA synthetase (AMP-forming)/AMP-acid ligase II
MFYPVSHSLQMVEGLTGLFSSESHETIARQLERHAAQRPTETFLLFEGERYTYAQADAAINRHAHAYRELGIRRGDVVALLLENRPEYLWHVFALHKLGAISSVINSHLQGDALAHAIKICRPRHVIAGSEVWANVTAVRGRLEDADLVPFEVDLDARAAGTKLGPLWNDRLTGKPESAPSGGAVPTLDAQAAYIYTSGTTGMPKAAIVRHSRFFRAGRVWASIGFAFRGGDVLYNCLPLYHSNALLLATSSVITAGVSMALSRKFSRTSFWEELRRYDARAFIYIGELCRYLMNTPASPRDRDHNVHVMSGNGLRPDIWRGFQQRFGVRRIVEFYGATEGNCITLNALGLTGSVGPRMPNMALARWDEAKNDFVRRPDGRLIRSQQGEPGVLLGRIRRHAEFDGYHDKAASESKVVRDAFDTGDAWFNTGDLLRMDALFHLYFVDRLGDTFRWKGENVATSEVQEQLSQWPPVREVNVYGVAVPGAEGRAGMAALVLEPDQAFDPADLRRHVEQRLPSYARPRFLRLMSELSTTSTFKVKKVDLQKQGYDPARVQDPLYLLHPEQDAYVALTPELYAAISSGRLRL